MAEWLWDAERRRYREKATGRYLSASAERDLRDDFVDRTRKAVRELSEGVASGELTVDEWEERVRTHVRLVHTAQYMFGRGGKNAMAIADRIALSQLVHKQWAFLGEFADDVREQELSAAQIGARSEQYVGSAVASYSAGRAAAFAGLSLPAHPGDGSTRCHGRCRCVWTISETEKAYEASWLLGGGESCPDCEERAATWAPLVFPKARAA